MARVKKEETQAFSVRFPKSLVEEIEVLCAANYITKSSWLIKAAKELLEKERKQRSEELLNRLVKQDE